MTARLIANTNMSFRERVRQRLDMGVGRRVMMVGFCNLWSSLTRVKMLTVNDRNTILNISSGEEKYFQTFFRPLVSSIPLYSKKSRLIMKILNKFLFFFIFVIFIFIAYIWIRDLRLKSDIMSNNNKMLICRDIYSWPVLQNLSSKDGSYLTI